MTFNEHTPTTIRGGVEIRPWRGQLGLFATRRFARGAFVLEVEGWVSRNRTVHSIQIDQNRHIEPTNDARFLNHACQPNLFPQIACAEEVFFCAAEPIEAGDHLTFDYASTEAELFSNQGRVIPTPCLCASTKCRSVMRGYKQLSAAEHRSVLHIASPHAERYIRSALALNNSA